MHETIKYISSNPLINLISFLLAILGIILSVYYYLKSRKEKIPVFSKQSFQLIQKSITGLDKLEVKYNDQRVDKLTLTKVAFWNSGRETIRKEDVVQRDPIKITTKEDLLIYDHKIISSNPKNNFTLERINDQTINIYFDYMDHFQGIIINIYHNGQKSDDIQLEGTIIGARKLDTGIRKKYILQKVTFIDIILKPVNKLINDKNIVFRICGFILGLFFGMFLLPIMIALLLIDEIYGLYYNYNKAPKKFKLFDEYGD